MTAEANGARAANGGLAGAFFTALLLTRSLEGAERAVAAAIRTGGSGQTVMEALPRAVMETSLDEGGEWFPATAEEVRASAALLPPELRGVLLLPPELRHCFVLRVLAGLPARVCNEILHIDTDEIDRNAREATAALARPSGKSASGGRA